MFQTVYPSKRCSATLPWRQGYIIEINLSKCLDVKCAEECGCHCSYICLWVVMSFIHCLRYFITIYYQGVNNSIFFLSRANGFDITCVIGPGKMSFCSIINKFTLKIVSEWINKWQILRSVTEQETKENLHSSEQWKQ